MKECLFVIGFDMDHLVEMSQSPLLIFFRENDHSEQAVGFVAGGILLKTFGATLTAYLPQPVRPAHELQYRLRRLALSSIRKR
ncbi:MAG TPA: hypothetical protein PK250_11380 [Syntrophobacter fumaroxidans]|nr:hypothetical protein [Syntrophobacter fumaroxidans]